MEIFDKARQWLEHGRPFVVFRKPDAKQVTGVFQNNATSYASPDLDGNGFVFTSFDSEKTWILPETDSETFTSDYSPATQALSSPELEIDGFAQREFESLVAKGISHITSGAFEKVVLSRTETVKLDAFDALVAFEKLTATYPSAFVYLWFHPETQIWMAATPEKLLKANGRHFETMALAGTQKFQGEEMVEWARKEKEEQRFVTDFIWNSLEDVVSEIELDAPYTYRAGNLLHIRTDIKGELNDAADLSKVISVLHPTPAVCGLPKDEAKRFIVENEGYDREFYAGFIGQLNSKDGTDLYVNLRCMKVAGNLAQLFVGCGITKDSNPEKEFFETVNKSLTIRKALF